MAPYVFVHRDELHMVDVMHDPEESWIPDSHTFRENWQVTVTSGPMKGYHGRVRKVWRNDIEVELEAVSRIVKFSPDSIARRMYVN